MPKGKPLHKTLYIDEPLVRHFMRGYFDGDGGISINKKEQVHISVCGTEKFLQVYMGFLVDNAGVNYTKIIPHHGIYMLQYCGNGNAKKIFSWLYSGRDECLDRKLQVVKSYCK